MLFSVFPLQPKLVIVETPAVFSVSDLILQPNLLVVCHVCHILSVFHLFFIVNGTTLPIAFVRKKSDTGVSGKMSKLLYLHGSYFFSLLCVCAECVCFPTTLVPFLVSQLG